MRFCASDGRWYIQSIYQNTDASFDEGAINRDIANTQVVTRDDQSSIFVNADIATALDALALFDNTSGNSTFERVANTPINEILFGGVRDVVDDLNDIANLQFFTAASRGSDELIEAIRDVAGDEAADEANRLLMDAARDEVLAYFEAWREVLGQDLENRIFARWEYNANRSVDEIIVYGSRALARDQALLATIIVNELRRQQLRDEAFELGRQNAEGRFTLAELRTRFGLESPEEVFARQSALFSEAYQITDADVAATRLRLQVEREALARIAERDLDTLQLALDGIEPAPSVGALIVSSSRFLRSWRASRCPGLSTKCPGDLNVQSVAQPCHQCA